MSVMGLGEQQQSDILRTVAAILHLGNVTFTEKGNYAEIATPPRRWMSQNQQNCWG
ncbi:hypothetical protein J6590_019349 [Homalodisca vitripennis]|nr:hypothetical protein J6590_019349 [Homalodisca vitripennis]